MSKPLPKLTLTYEQRVAVQAKLQELTKEHKGAALEAVKGYITPAADQTSLDQLQALQADLIHVQARRRIHIAEQDDTRELSASLEIEDIEAAIRACVEMGRLVREWTSIDSRNKLVDLVMTSARAIGEVVAPMALELGKAAVKSQLGGLGGLGG